GGVGDRDEAHAGVRRVASEFDGRAGVRLDADGEERVAFLRITQGVAAGAAGRIEQSGSAAGQSGHVGKVERHWVAGALAEHEDAARPGEGAGRGPGTGAAP